MSKGKKGTDPDVVKSTILLDRGLKQHLAIASIATGLDQSEIIRRAVIHMLTEMGCDLTAPPRLPEIDVQKAAAFAAHATA